MIRTSGGALQAARVPAGWLYYLISAITLVAGALALGVRIRRDPAIRHLKGPLIVIGNHPSYLDPFFMGAALFPKRLNFVTADGFFRSPLICWCLRKLGAIPKVQFRSDMQALRSMFGVLRRGGILAIYPEGQRSLDGGRQPVEDSIAKLIRKVRCPVVTVIENGAYLTWPRWSLSGIRPGRIEIGVHLLLSAVQVAAMDTPSIQAAIAEALDYQDYAWQRRRPHRFLSRSPALGLHNVCHKCPACSRDLAMLSSRFVLACRYCGNAGRMDLYGLIHPDGKTSRVFPDAGRWRAWQLDRLAGEIRRPDFRLVFRARMEILGSGGVFKSAGSGWIRLQGSRLDFDYGQEDQAGQAQGAGRHSFPIGHKSGISADYGLQFELVHADRTYRFVPDEGQAVILLADAIQIIARQTAGGDEDSLWM